MKSLIKNNILYIYVILFLIISCFSINSIERYLPSQVNNIYEKQLFWYVIGFIIIYFIKKIDIKKIYNFSIYLYFINVLLLIGLFVFGNRINNALSWYKLFGVTIQPSEFMKVSIILFNSYTIHKYYKNRDKISKIQELKLLFVLFIILLIPSILTFLQPDTGAVIGYFIISISMIYISGIDKRWLYLFSLFFLIVLISFILIYLIDKKILIDILGKSVIYRIDRIINWKNKIGLQLNNSLVVIGSCGLFGHSNIPIYYPEAMTDFIFTSYVSLHGLFGILLLFLLLILFDLHIINCIKKEKSFENRYTLFGIISLFFYQQIQSISMTIGLLPINGITFPLISYGGSSLISYLILIGIVLNIKEKEKKL